MRAGVIRFSQLSGPCPNGHRVCLSAGCWLTEHEVSYAIRLEAAYQITLAYRALIEGDAAMSRAQFWHGRWSKHIRRDP